MSTTIAQNIEALCQEQGIDRELVIEEIKEAMLQKHYSGRASEAEAVQQLIQAQARGSDQPIRALVLRLHHYTQTLPDPAAWFREQLDSFATEDPARWREWLRTALVEWRERYRGATPLMRKKSTLAYLRRIRLPTASTKYSFTFAHRNRTALAGADN